MEENFSAIILAAGYSERMGQPKPLLKFDSGRCFARKIADELLAFGCNMVVMVTNQMVINQIATGEFGLNDITIALNSNPEWGRFYSLYLAVQNIPPNSYAFIVNADNPFINFEILKQVWEQRMNADYLYPVFSGKGGHPILISPRIISQIINESSYRYNLKDYLNRFSKLQVPVNDKGVLININSPEDYQLAFGNSLS